MQTTLQFDAPPRIHSSPTSCLAAEGIAPIAGTMRAKALDFIRTHPGTTDNELCAGIESPNGGRARRIELYRAGLIEKSGVRDGCTTWRVK